LRCYCCWRRDCSEYLPEPALAAVVIASAIGLFEVGDLRRIYRIQRWEFWLSIACFAGVAILGAIPGIGLAIVIAVIEFLWDGWRPHSAVLGRVDGVKGYHDITRHPDARRIPASSCFAGMRRCSSRTPNSSRTACWTRGNLADAGALAGRGSGTGHQRGRHLRRHACRARRHAARCRHRAVLRRDEGSRQGQAEAIRAVRAAGRRGFFPTLGEAVGGYVKTYSVDWVDWEDRPR
jgi:hypothetical protein